MRKEILSHHHRANYGLIIFLVTYPILFYLYRLIPNDLKEFHFIGYTYSSLYYESIYVLMWTLVGKLLPLFAFSYIFIKVKNVWSYALFSPVIMYIFQIIAVVNEDIGSVDKVEFFYCLPVFVTYCFLLYRYKLFLNRQSAKQDYKRELVETGLEGILNHESLDRGDEE